MPLKLRGSLPKSLPPRKRPTGPAPTINSCPSCGTRQRRNLSTRRVLPSPRPRTQPTQLHRPDPSSLRPFATPYSTSPSTAHTARHVPPRLRELYDSLARLQSVAPEQVNLSRLQLALRGLESEEPLVRVAVLGLNDITAARKLVRLLLADPLKGREDWEDILDGNGDLERGLLIQYGDVAESISNHLLPTISVPSPVLKKGNLEILITSLGAGADLSGAQLTADTFFVPTVTIQTSHTGRHNMVRYPVHRSIVCAQGVDGLLAYSGLIAQSDLNREAGSIYAAVELGAAAPLVNHGQIAFVDTKKADQALAKFRESVQNATLYEQGWNSSGLPPVVDWLSTLRGQEASLNPSVKALITSIVDATERSVVAEETRHAQELEEASVSDAVREGMDQSVSTWAERGHTELRDALEEGFATRKWRELAWWKLFWHVDDVGMITGEILEKKYLRRAEREVIWTAGQLEQAGLRDPKNHDDTTIMPTEQAAAKQNVAVAVVEQSKEILPWPTQIAKSRARLLETTVPSLQALAQRLVFFTLSTTSLTSVLSVLTQVSLPTASIYETGTIAAVGLIYSLRRQQRKWDAARVFFEEEVREEGRSALLETEEQMRTAVREGGRNEENITAHKARKAIAQAREALDNVQ
ncbi:hypothetical protein BJX61DRAFT_540757 [Aspergillus egyptiacus]|nr:hypothetical protein BJX61DRAFT_540757 [Aspergillus egyptiacus]